MRAKWRVSIILAVAAVYSLGAASSVSAQAAKIVAGTLTCKGKGSVGLIIGSTEQLSCTYTPAGKNSAQHYRASLTTVGLDIGFKGENVMIWTVLGSTSDLPAGALAGKYGGVSAETAVGVGVGANALLGGSKDSVVLQPLSVEGQKGLNLAVGISGLTLQYVPSP